MTARRPTSKEMRGWARVVRSVRPLHGVSPPELKPPTSGNTLPSEPEKAHTGLRAPKLPDTLEPGPTRPVGAGRRDGERKVRRGQVSIDARFDLHGFTQSEAEQRLPAFLDAQRRAGARCVLVITGKGRAGEGVLKRNFLHWLASGRAEEHVSSYAPAHARHGGGGAFYVFLRRN